jgi:hypothetical protein
MFSLTDSNNYEKIVERIEQLKPGTKPLWGAMNVNQMMLHCQMSFKLAFEELTMRTGLLGFLFGKLAKKQMIKNKPFKKNLPTAPPFKTSHLNPDFEITKKQLLNYIKRFRLAGSEGITQKPHPFFGKMSFEEWDTLQFKHLDHHLKQFGV